MNTDQLNTNQATKDADSPIDYPSRQAAEEEQYKTAWDEWLKTLTPRERKELKDKGIEGAHIDSQGVGGPELDTDRLSSDPVTDEAEAMEDDGLDFDDPRVIAKATEMVRLVVGELLTSTNKALSVECFALVTGIGYQGSSQTAIAKRHGVTRAAVSKRCVELTEALGLHTSRAMKRAESRDNCRVAQLEAHSRWTDSENWEDDSLD